MQRRPQSTTNTIFLLKFGYRDISARLVYLPADTRPSPPLLMRLLPWLEAGFQRLYAAAFVAAARNSTSAVDRRLSRHFARAF